jgi:hypothetical protein
MLCSLQNTYEARMCYRCEQIGILEDSAFIEGLLYGLEVDDSEYIFVLNENICRENIF